MSGFFEPITRTWEQVSVSGKPLRTLLPALLLASCVAPEDPGFSPDLTSPTPKDETTECSPTLSAGTAAKGENDEWGIFIRFSFGWTNGECESSVASGDVRVHTLNLDAADPTSAEANIYYEVPFTTSGVEGSLVTLDTSNGTASVDIPFEEEGDTYEVTVNVVDNVGYTSNTLTWEVVYEDLDETVE